MSVRSNYTPEEWRVLSALPVLVGGAVAAAAPSGFLGTFQEGRQVISSMFGAARLHENNQLIQDIAPKGLDAESAKGWFQVAQGLVRTTEAERMRDECLKACQQVNSVLSRKASYQDAEDYKHWILEIGEDTAKAASEKGEQISPQESRLLQDIATSLKAPAL